MRKCFRSEWFQISLVMFIAAAWKGLLILWAVIPFNSDEAVVALMARHILQGERPVFFYGQAYMGSLDAFLVAAGFWLLGEQVVVIRLVQMLLYLGVVFTTIWIGKEAFGSTRVGLLGALLLAVPTVNVTLYTTASLGGYGEALLLGNGILLLSLVAVRRRIFSHEDKAPWAWFFLWGILNGCGLWANGLTLVYSVPSGLYLLWALWQHRRGWLPGFAISAAAGFLAGSAPWWLYALQHGPSLLVLELLGNAVAVEQSPWLIRTGQHLINFLLLGVTALFGLRPPWEVRWLALPLLPFVLFFWVAVILFLFRRLFRAGEGHRPVVRAQANIAHERSSYLLLAGVCAVLLAGFLFTSFGVDPSGRYFLPMSVPLSLIAAQFILNTTRQGWQAVGLVALVVGYHLIGTLQCALRFPPGLTTQFHEPTVIDHRADGELIEFLKGQGETTGYSNYWVAYPLAFQSQEALIFVPRLPYHLDLRYTPRDDRYPAYTARAASSSRVAYITTRNPELDLQLRQQFSALGVTWQEHQIGDYQIYYHLSQAVHPQEIGFGELRE